MKPHLSACVERLLSALPPLSAEQRAAARVIDRFETLGDNCEFGFVQRRLGREDGGLLRWTATPPDSLTRALEDRFSHLYAFDDLEPLGPRMVRDRAYGLGFHTQMHSQGGIWQKTEAERRSLHAQEAAKYLYLRDKLLERLADPTRIAVYKTNPPNRASAYPALITAYNTLARATLLLVEIAPTPDLRGTVHRADEYLIGYVRAFAPYENARAFSRDWWRVLISAAAMTGPSERP